MPPFHAREVDAPLIAVARRSGLVSKLAEHLPGKSDFYGPAPVGVARIIERPVYMDCRLQTWDFPTVHCGSAVSVGADEEQVPTGVQGVHLELVILVIVAVGIDENFKVVVVEDDRVMLR